MVSLREMVNSLSKSKAYFALFTPSGLGMVLYMFAAFVVIGLNQVPIVKDYLELPADLDFFRIFAGWVDTLLLNTLGEGRTNAFVVGLFWAFVGLGVYIFLQALARFIYELGEGLEERRYVWPKGSSRLQPLKLIVERAIFRVVAFCVLVYVLFGPLAQLVKQAPYKDFVGSNVVLQYIVWFLGILFISHCALVLVRLIALRARLFE